MKLKRLVKKSERELTNIEYTEMIEKIEKSHIRFMRTEIIEMLEYLSQFDRSDQYVKDLFDKMLDLLLKKYDNDLIPKYYGNQYVDSVDRNGSSSVIEEIRNKVMLREIDEKEMGQLLDSTISQLNEKEKEDIKTTLTIFCINNKDEIDEDFLLKYVDYIYFNLLFGKDFEFSEALLEKLYEKGKAQLHEITAQKISEEFIIRHEDEIMSDYAARVNTIYNPHIVLSEDFILKHFKDLKSLNPFFLDQLCKKYNNILSDDAINTLFQYNSRSSLPLYHLRITQEVEETFDEENEYLWKVQLSQNPDLDEDFIERHFDKLNIHEILKTNRMISEDFVKRNMDLMMYPSYWKNVSENVELSEDFIWGNKMNVDWEKICLNQKLSVGFILNKALDYVARHKKSLKNNKNINQKEMQRYKVYEILSNTD
jgi:hypothetical protein